MAAAATGARDRAGYRAFALVCGHADSSADAVTGLGPFGLWTFALDRQPWSRAKEAAAEIEAMGWSAIWVPEATNRNGLVNATLLLGATTGLTVATGIAPIHNRDAMASANAQRTLDEAFPDRFLFGLGVSHQWLVEDVRGGHYGKPLGSMRAYLEAMDAAPFTAFAPTAPPRRVLAALGPKMLALAAERADGAHPYLTRPGAHRGRPGESSEPTRSWRPTRR